MNSCHRHRLRPPLRRRRYYPRHGRAAGPRRADGVAGGAQRLPLRRGGTGKVTTLRLRPPLLSCSPPRDGSASGSPHGKRPPLPPLHRPLPQVRDAMDRIHADPEVKAERERHLEALSDAQVGRGTVLGQCAGPPIHPQAARLACLWEDWGVAHQPRRCSPKP